ncbi:hypothetical protein HAV22_21465 [Massilia sp. TW-1]|uniref:Uncharacterized protein n=1 Tax=Telluria antibiotica TaxID=2717319 RepID=A0ABX0PI11_9BURK|nr:hypothetical protein [Telluria antibiotica]NIA56204.1 hypothetical protein [Telluria antibiotica]
MNKLYTILGIAGQFAALLYVADMEAKATHALVFLALQGGASALLALGSYKQIHAGKSARPSHELVYLFALNMTMPVAGLASLALGQYLAKRFTLTRHDDNITTLDEPCFTLHRGREGYSFRGGEVRARLLNKDTPTNQKMGALASIQETPARVTRDILHSLLTDSCDDIRLLAYGILDGKEKEVTRRILKLEKRLARCGRSEAKEVHHQLTELYWELIYQSLVQGDLLVHSAEQMRTHARLVLEHGDDASIWFLLTRLELAMNNPDAAQLAFDHACRCSCAPERLLPYLAELRYLQRRHLDVRATLLRLAGMGVPSLEPAMRYWLGGATAPDTDTGDLAGVDAILPARGRSEVSTQPDAPAAARAYRQELQ